MENPYFKLHKDFTKAGAKVIMSSGQACVLFGIAAFSKDGNWIVEETEISCQKILEVLDSKGAGYRLGAPLDIRWLYRGWTSHFEYFLENTYRMRVDFCSRPPRVGNLKKIWQNKGTKEGVDFIDIENLIALKQTRRVRDYNIIGVLAEVIGFNQGNSHVALQYLQDFNLLKKAVEKWPEESKACKREAVQLAVNKRSRREIITALAIEQDEKIQQDEERISLLINKSKSLQASFIRLKKSWVKGNVPLMDQHSDLLQAAKQLLVKI